MYGYNPYGMHPMQAAQMQRAQMMQAAQMQQASQMQQQYAQRAQSMRQSRYDDNDDYNDRYSRRDAAEDMRDKMDRMMSGGLGDRDEGRRSRYDDDDRRSRYDAPAPAPRQPSYYDAPAPAAREPEQLRKPSDVLGPSGAQWDPPAGLAQYAERPSGWRVEPSQREAPAPYQHPTGDDRYPNRKLLPKGAYSGPGGIPMMGPYNLAGPDGMVRDMSSRSYGRGRFMKVEDWEKERDERRARGNRW